MLRMFWQADSFDRFAIGFLGLCIVNLCVLALMDAPSGSAILSPPAAAPQAVGSADHGMKRAAVIPVGSAAKLAAIFAERDYRLDIIRAGGEVPRLYIANMPRDFGKILRPSKRKTVFIMTALPLILQANEDILRDRGRIEILHVLSVAGVEPSREDAAWLRAISERYGLKKVDFRRLLSRVDIIPPSLALAQGAEESGWGTSRFAREGNALFGQRIFGDRGGIVPKERAKGQRFRVRAFALLRDGVKAYMHNLNTHFAYAGLRERRRQLRAHGHEIGGDDLVGMLGKYSERGPAYIKSIRTIIRSNRLTQYDRARLRGETGHPDA